jgi:hypothetical protein
MSDIVRHPAWPNSRTSTGGWSWKITKRDGRLVDTPTVRAIEEFFGIYDLEDWMLRAYYLRHLTYAEIADEIGVTGGTVSVWFKAMGLSIRQVASEVMEERLRESATSPVTGERREA